MHSPLSHPERRFWREGSCGCESGFGLIRGESCYTFPVTLQINGESRDFVDGLTLAALIAQLGSKPDRVAVELNLEIVSRDKWQDTILRNGDRLEIVHFVGGGNA